MSMRAHGSVPAACDLVPWPVGAGGSWMVIMPFGAAFPPRVPFFGGAEIVCTDDA